MRVKLKMKGIRQLLRSGPVQDEVARKAKAMADDAGEGFEYIVKPHKYTARAFVQTERGTNGADRQAREHVLQRVAGRRR